MAVEERICDEQRENQQGCKQKVVGQRWHMDTFRTLSATRDVFAHLACHAHLAASEQTVVNARSWPFSVARRQPTLPGESALQEPGDRGSGKADMTPPPAAAPGSAFAATRPRAQYHLAALRLLPPDPGNGRDLLHPLRDLAFVEVIH